MKINLFKKKVTTRSGKTFFKFVTTLKTKDGKDVYTDVMISEDEVEKVKKVPCVVTFSKENANMSVRKTTDNETGKEYVNRKLWISKIDAIEPYIDTSLDDFE